MKYRGAIVRGQGCICCVYPRIVETIKMKGVME